MRIICENRNDWTWTWMKHNKNNKMLNALPMVEDASTDDDDGR